MADRCYVILFCACVYTTLFSWMEYSFRQKRQGAKKLERILGKSYIFYFAGFKIWETLLNAGKFLTWVLFVLCEF